MKSLVWFRRDLRISDNASLSSACQNGAAGVIGLFLITAEQWLEHDDADCKVQFWLENLRSLSRSLAKLNIPLRIETCDSFEQASATIIKFAKSHDVATLFFNREYEVNERSRDESVARACKDGGIEVHQFHDRVIVPPREIETQEGNFYSVFTPYRKVWDNQATSFADQYATPKSQTKLDLEPSEIPDALAGYKLDSLRTDLWPPGEEEAAKRLDRFIQRISAYDDSRDVPSTNGTSLLSPYLAAGVVSPRRCFQAAIAANNGKVRGNNEGATTWISELAWRDFYTHVMVGFPRVSRHGPFKLKTDDLEWRDNDDDLEAWKSGQTGYPIVDAGMRQLQQTGWMHNRLRMVTAMFLTKHLLIDWRLGEKHFMQNLIDGDLAANNGGWQWSASTGTDAAPYFRIFNPFSQSKRFDSEGKFIRKLCPELEEVPASSLHDPVKLAAAIDELRVEYPAMIVEHKPARERALAAFKALD